MEVFLKSLRAIPLKADFATIYGGDDKIPDEIKRPASHFQAIPRVGQYATVVLAESSDGAIGIGECFGLPTPHAAAAMVNRVIGPAVEGRALCSPSEMLADLRRYFIALGHSGGPGMEALSGADIALWDLEAKRRDLSLSALLGGATAPLATYVSPLPFLETPEKTAEAAMRLAEGFRAVKLKVGRRGNADVPFVQAARDAIGPDRALMLDANCAYTLSEAQALENALRDTSIAWLEEPLPPTDLAGLRTLSHTAHMPLAAGENAFTEQAMTALIVDGGVIVIQPNISRAGGVTGLLEIDRLAAAHGAKVAPHGVGGSIVLAATLHAATAMSAFETFEINRMPNPLRDDFGAVPSFDARGFATPPEGPGHGITLSDDDIDRFRDPPLNRSSTQ